MPNVLKKLILGGMMVLMLSGEVIVASDAIAQGDYGVSAAADKAGLPKTVANQPTIPGVVGAIVKAGLSLIGIAFFLLALYAGVKWMSAMGKAEEAEKAKDILEAAVIGLVLVLAAYAITRFVFTNLAP